MSMNTTPDALIRAADITAIQQVIALFAIAVDTKEFHRLHEVFAPEVIVNFNLPGFTDLHGPEVVSNLLQKQLEKVAGQHDQTACLVEMTAPDTAKAITNFVGTTFGSGERKGQVLQNWGRYVDVLKKKKEGWRITARELITVGRMGDIEILFPDG